MSQILPVYHVTDLVNEMRRLVEASYPEIWVEGELSSLSTPASGHLYFTLKDEQSQLRCAMFRQRAEINHYRPKAGDLVRVRAKISVYTARGDLQCIVQHIENAGEGALQRRFEELKVKLDKMGLFDARHKQRLPEFPRHIGLITSPTGAAVKDILTTLARRCPGIPVTLYPAVVQGEGAVKTLLQAISDAVQHQRCDVILLARGGGSLEDLWCFNDEALANAIYQCPIPIISAVGHEVDVTIADFVADLRAPTPTAAAELLSPDNLHLQQRLVALTQRMRLSFRRFVERRAQRVDLSFQQLQHPILKIKSNQQQLATAGKRLQRGITARLRASDSNFAQCSLRMRAQSPLRHIRLSTDRLQLVANRLHRSEMQLLKSNRLGCNALASQLHLVSPLATLDRGFSITRDASDAIVRHSETVRPGDALKLQLKSGRLRCRVTGVIK